MLRTFSKILLSVMLVVALSSVASATYVTTNGDLHLSDFPPGTVNPDPLEDIKRVGLNVGNIYTNSSPNSTAIGTTVISISYQEISNALNGVNQSASLPDTSTAVIITAVTGSIVGFDPVFGTPIVRFTAGTAFFTSGFVGGSASNPADPSSWFFGAGGLPFAQMSLAPQADLIQGAPGVGSQIGFTAAGNLNVSFPNSGTPGDVQGKFVFLEASTAAQNAGITPGSVPGSGGDGFLFNVDNPFAPVPPSNTGIVSFIDQDVEAVAIGPGFTFDGADLAMLNAIAAAAGFANLGGASTGFATGIGAGPGSNFNPFGGGPASPGNFNGDFRANFSSEVHIIAANIPEPTSMLAWSLTMVSLAGVRFARGLRKKA